MVSVRYDDGAVHDLPLADVRIEHFENSVPWRTFRSYQGQRHYSGSYASVTMDKFVIYESRLELARLMLADFDSEIERIYAQPMRIGARVEGRARWHVPDFLLVKRAGTALLVNVKPADLLTDPKIAAAMAWPGELAGRVGWEYEVWSGADPVVLENVRFLSSYKRASVVPAELVERTREAVAEGEQIAAVERRLAGEAPVFLARPGPMALLWRGELTTDLARPLSGASVLGRPV